MTTLQLESELELLAPHSTEAEVAVLGALLLSPDAGDDVFEVLSPTDFYVPAHQLIAEATKALYDAGSAIDAVTVVEALRSADGLRRVGGIGYVLELVDAVPTTSNVAHYVDIVRQRAVRRRLLRTAQLVGRDAADLSRDVGAVVDEAEAAVLAVADGRESARPTPIGGDLEEVLARFVEGPAGGIGTGYRDLDALVAPIEPGEFVVMAGRPSMGKSALAAGMAYRVAALGHPVVVFSLEMTRRALLERLVCSVARVDAAKARRGELDDGDWERIYRVLPRLEELPLYVCEAPGLTVAELRAKTRRYRRAAGDLALVIVDYLQLMEGPGENRQQEIASISRGLVTVAKELDTVMVAVSQLNRGVEARENKRPRLADLRESGSLEQDADAVLLLYRDEYYNSPTAATEGVAEIAVAKRRNGPTGTVELAFIPTHAGFEDAAQLKPTP